MHSQAHSSISNFSGWFQCCRQCSWIPRVAWPSSISRAESYSVAVPHVASPLEESSLGVADASRCITASCAASCHASWTKAALQWRCSSNSTGEIWSFWQRSYLQCNHCIRCSSRSSLTHLHFPTQSQSWALNLTLAHNKSKTWLPVLNSLHWQHYRTCLWVYATQRLSHATKMTGWALRPKLVSNWVRNIQKCFWYTTFWHQMSKLCVLDVLYLVRMNKAH